MLVFIIGIIGFILTILAALEIYRLEGDMIKKVLFIVLLFITNWLGLVIYYLFARKEMPKWVK